MDEDSKIQLEQAAISVKNAVFSNIPVVGGILDEVLFEHRNRVKQERLNRFVEEFKKYLRSMGSCDIDQKHLKSEEFGDIFESILRKVVNTASEEKVHRFKKILLNEMEHTYESDFKETFLDIAFRINEDQIQILKHFWNVKDGCESEDNSEQKVVDGEGAEASLKYKANLLGFDESKYLFYVQDLISKSLLFDEYVGVFGGAKPYTNLRITPFGEEFLKFIEGSPDQ
jgi:hypothetical protein